LNPHPRCDLGGYAAEKQIPISSSVSQLSHSTGHGLGLEVHEAPRVSKDAPKLKSGNVITIEPGLYYPVIGDCRIEDAVRVTKDGYEKLSNLYYRWEYQVKAMMRIFWFTLLSLMLVACEKASEEGTDALSERERRHQEAVAQIEASNKAREAYHRELPDEAYRHLFKELARQSEFAQEFLRQFPDAYQISARSFAHIGPPTPVSEQGILEDKLVLIAELYGRYRFRCFIPFYLSDDYQTLASISDPHFDLLQRIKVTGKEPNRDSIQIRSVLLPDGSQRFEYEFWEQLQASDFNWRAVGIWLIEDRPLDDFDRMNQKTRERWEIR